MNSFKCTRFPRFAKLGIRFAPFLNESVDLEKFGGEFTNDEIAEMVLSFGETNNLMDGGWILPTGEVLDFRRSDMSNNAIRHSRIYLAFSPERKALLEKYMSLKDLLWSDDSIAIDVCLAAGFIRYHFLEKRDDAVAYLSLEKKPTEKQLDILRDLADEVSKTASLNFIGVFECNGHHVSYDDPKKFGFRLVNDIMNCF